MSSFVLKLIATTSMLIDHSGYLIFNKFSFMNCIGRLAFPIFAYLITEGFIHTSNLKKYFSRLIIFGIISQIPYMLLFPGNFSLNILFSLALGLLSITVYNKSKIKLLGILFVISSAIGAELLHFDYGWFGIAIIFIFYIFKNKKIYMNIFFIISTFVRYILSFFIPTLKIEYLLRFLFCSLSLIPINLYNGKKGKNIKYFLYAFYPLHLIILYLIKLI